jgi:hypothetical protein
VDKSVAQIRPILYKVPKSFYSYLGMSKKCYTFAAHIDYNYLFFLKSAASENKDLKLTKVLELKKKIKVKKLKEKINELP